VLVLGDWLVLEGLAVEVNVDIIEKAGFFNPALNFTSRVKLNLRA
jgi:hypothetical protein